MGRFSEIVPAGTNLTPFRQGLLLIWHSKLSAWNREILDAPRFGWFSDGSGPVRAGLPSAHDHGEVLALPAIRLAPVERKPDRRAGG